MRNKCRTCGNVRKEGVDWYDDDYCSGKCKKADGGEVEPVAEQIKSSGEVASLADYLLDYPKNLGGKDARGQRIKGRMPKRYRRRYDPEKLNWGTPMNTEELEQAGFRANREPIFGDCDYEADVDSLPDLPPPILNDWQLLKAKAKSFGIPTHGKKKEQLEAEIKERYDA